MFYSSTINRLSLAKFNLGESIFIVFFILYSYFCAFSSQVSNMSENNSSNSSTTPAPFPGANATGTLPNTTSTWPNLQETLQFERAASAIVSDRPHTISSAYERGHQRPALTVYTFQAPDGSHSQPASPVSALATRDALDGTRQQSAERQSQPIYARPPIPQRCSSLERPSVPAKVASVNAGKIGGGRVQQLVKTEPPKIILPATQPLVAKGEVPDCEPNLQKIFSF